MLILTPMKISTLKSNTATQSTTQAKTPSERARRSRPLPNRARSVSRPTTPKDTIGTIASACSLGIAACARPARSNCEAIVAPAGRIQTS